MALPMPAVPDPSVSMFGRWLALASPAAVVEALTEANPQALLADGFEAALVGIVYRKGMEPIALYDRNAAVASLVVSGMDEDEAEEYFCFNVDDAWVGEGAPAWLVRPEGL